MEVEIFNSGSDGNLILIEDCIVIDIGVKKALTSEFLSDKKIEAVFISHRHSDHLNIPSLRWIENTYPNLRDKALFMNKESREYLTEKGEQELVPVSAGTLLHDFSSHLFMAKGQLWRVWTFPLVHDVENQAFIFQAPNGETLVHITDTASTSKLLRAPKTMPFNALSKFDYLLVEGNYDEEDLARDLASNDDNVRWRAERNLRHLSVQKFAEFVKAHAHSKSTVIQLHESSDYGTIFDLSVLGIA